MCSLCEEHNDRQTLKVLVSAVEDLNQKLDRLIDMQTAKAYAEQPEHDDYNDFWGPEPRPCGFCAGSRKMSGGSLGERDCSCVDDTSVIY